ncbi:hypothetical protein I7I50_10593 [Histoplasma capsulatum G186AR]|uniref:Uncharacterized protein n=1 Tax=Ajellomyces capsulatus TaxID=5037 RepID=A0A8H8D6I1_AJECA|nr:hypothetical protein I7I52_01832 [Histoplasma capsulatum]QSS69336.1 hypothetical protein I7I50_10593 [Histoplasma capsulatum G186AR]
MFARSYGRWRASSTRGTSIACQHYKPGQRAPFSNVFARMRIWNFGQLDHFSFDKKWFKMNQGDVTSQLRS